MREARVICGPARGFRGRSPVCGVRDPLARPEPGVCGKPCWELVMDDWADNASIDRPYSVNCLQQALDRAPEDIRAYSDIEDQIRQALRDTVVRRPQSSGSSEGPIEQALSVDTNDARSIPIPLLVLAACASALIIAGGRGSPCASSAADSTPARDACGFRPATAISAQCHLGRVRVPSAARPRVGSAGACIGAPFRSTCARCDAAALAEPAPTSSPRVPGGGREPNDAAPRFDWQGSAAAGDVGTPRTRTTRTLRSRAAARRTCRASGTSEPRGMVSTRARRTSATPGRPSTRTERTRSSISRSRAIPRWTFVATTFLTFELNHDARLWNNGQAMIRVGGRRHPGLLRASRQRCRRGAPALEVDGGRPGNGVLDPRPPRRADRADPERRRTRAINATAITSRLPGYYEDSAGRAVRRGSAQPEPDPRGRARHRQVLVRLGVDALALVHLGAVEHAGLRGASQDHRALVLGLRRQVPRPRRGRPRDPGEPGLPGWIIWADYDDDGVGTPPSRSGSRMPKVTTSSTTSVRRAGHTCSARPLRRRWGSVVRAPAWVQLPERLHARRHRLRARRPLPLRWGPIQSATTAYARFRDFGNYVPATLVVEKQFEPSSDPGRFDLLVNGRVVVAAAGTARAALRESGPAPTPSRRLPQLGRTLPTTNQPSSAKLERGERGSARAASTRTSHSGPDSWRSAPSATSDSARPRSRSTRWGLPARQPETPCGISCSSAIRATFLPAASVEVDPNCDDPLALVGKADPPGADATPRTLDPGDIWTYSCSKKTAAPEDCRPSVVTNTAVVTGEAGGRTVRTTAVSIPISRAPPSLRPGRATQPYAGAVSAAAYAFVARCATGAVAAGRRRCSGRRRRLPSDLPGAFAAGLRESTSRAHGSLASACS